MTMPLLASFVAPLVALQTAPATAAKPSSLAEVPVEQATAPRCGIAFAIVQGWQAVGDPRGEEWPAMEATDGREFFVQAMARLIDLYSLDQADVQRLVQVELTRHEADDGEAIQSMMPACLALLRMTPLSAPEASE
ncbi:MAG: hypothetical protein AAF697_02735 [Pseudomonadota bacterium]